MKVRHTKVCLQTGPADRGCMTREDMIAAIEGEIARLEQIRELLRKSMSGRFQASDQTASESARRRRVLSPEARERIAQAQRIRWQKYRTATSPERE